MNVFVPLPEDFAVRRADLTLGLRSATLFYQELVVPGIGGAWCVRHFSWPVAGISLSREPECAGIRPVTIAHAVEALANKAEWTWTPESGRTADLAVLGKRAFAREPDEWRFKRLQDRECYVQATYRQTVTRALTEDAGLGFTQGSGRFNTMELSDAGEDLAEAFLDRPEQRGMGMGTPSLRRNLLNWVEGRFKPGEYVSDVRRRTGYRKATRAEKEIVRDRLLSLVPPTHGAAGFDPKRRERLAQCLVKVMRRAAGWDDVPGLLVELRKHGGERHAEEIETAMRFDEMKMAAVGFLARIAELVDRAGNRISCEAAARDGKAKKLCGALRHRAQAFLERPPRTRHPAADTFAAGCGEDVAAVAEFIVRRDNRILQAAGGSIWRGPVFRADFAGIQGADSDDRESMRKGRPQRIFQFLDLWIDCNG